MKFLNRIIGFFSLKHQIPVEFDDEEWETLPAINTKVKFVSRHGNILTAKVKVVDSEKKTVRLRRSRHQQILTRPIGEVVIQ